MKKTKLNNQLMYTNIVSFLGIIITLCGIIWTYVDVDNGIVFKILITVMLLFFHICCLITFVMFCQFAILDETGINFNTIFYKIDYVSWDAIVKIEILNLPTLSSRGGASTRMQWICIYTDYAQKAEIGGGNSKGKPPWQIKASKKNIKAIKQFAEKYCKNATIKLK